MPQKLPNFVLEKRKRLGYTQQDMAEKLGVLVEDISALEKDAFSVQGELLLRYCAMLRYRVSILPDRRH